VLYNEWRIQTRREKSKVLKSVYLTCSVETKKDTKNNEGRKKCSDTTKTLQVKYNPTNFTYTAVIKKEKGERRIA
jgi:hypothetical protein